MSGPSVNEHLANLYTRKEIVEAATLRNFRTVQTAGRREVARNVEFYNLDAIIAVGFRVNSARAIQFRQWASGVEWLGQVPELRANGPALIQPRATAGASSGHLSTRSSHHPSSRSKLFGLAR